MFSGDAHTVFESGGNVYRVFFYSFFVGLYIHVLLLYDRLSIFVVNLRLYCDAVRSQDRYTYHVLYRYEVYLEYVL